MARRMVDPPGGWMYGFPKILEEDYRQQLIDSGYPEGDIEFALRYSREWDSEQGFE